MLKMETSKKILLVSYAAAIILTVIVIYGTFASLDMTSVKEICLAAWAEVAASNVWYYKKAARENQLKIIKGMPPSVRRHIDMNAIINQESGGLF